MNKQQIVEILEGKRTDACGDGYGVIEPGVFSDIADEIMALMAQPVAKLVGKKIEGLEIMDDISDAIQGIRFSDYIESGQGEFEGYTTEVRPGGITYFPHDSDCECRHCQPKLWYEKDGVWNRKGMQSLGDEVI